MSLATYRRYGPGSAQVGQLAKTILVLGLPISTNTEDPSSLEHMTTLFEAFYGNKPDYRVLFPFGSIGSFRHPRDGQRNLTTFESHGMLGIAFGRSEFTNSMIFYNLTLDSFCTSADYRLDPHASIAENFPSVL